MSALLLALLLSAAPAAQTVTAVQGDTLPKIAKAALGDEAAASELRALNGLASDEVAPGTVVKLPGSERALALSAIAAAQHALDQARTDAPQREEARAQLAGAREHLRAARYQEAARAADGAWRLVSAQAQGPTQFTVEVKKDGETHVSSTRGTPVRVEGQGVVTPVYPGEKVVVTKGAAPSRPELTAANTASARPSLAAPALLEPADGKLEAARTPNGLGPITVRWKPVTGASSYEVEWLKAGAKKPLVLKTDKPEVKVASLATGKYELSVRAVGADGTRSDPARRAVELVPDALKLEVKGTTWK